MAGLMQKLWQDDEGALIATEFLFIAVILVIGLVVGLVYVRNAVTAKLSELAQAVLFLDVSYQFPSLNGNNVGMMSLAQSSGSNVFDNLPAHRVEFPNITGVQNQRITDSAVQANYVFSAFAQ